MQSLAIVSGSSSGLGAAAVIELERRGYHVCALDLRPGSSESPNVSQNRCDVTSAEQVEEIVAKAVFAHGPPRVLVNCAGAFRLVPLVPSAPFDLQWLETAIAVNLLGAFFVMRAMVRHLITLPRDDAREQGVIVNVASGGAYDGTAGSSAYAAAKGGLIAATLPLARELAPLGLRIMTIAPGPMRTPMLDDAPASALVDLAQQVPFPARLGEASEFAALVGHILDNRFLNGSTIRLDGAHRLAFEIAESGLEAIRSRPD